MGRRARMTGSSTRRMRAVGIAVVLALGGVGAGWAASAATNQTVITACANVDNALFLSTNGSCSAGETTVQWNQQGPQGLEGPPGQQGPQGSPGTSASAPVLALGPSAYKHGFTLSTSIGAPGSYVIDGSVDTSIVPAHPGVGFLATCRLLTGAVNGPATAVATWKLHFAYHRRGKVWVPAQLNAPVNVNAGVDVTHNILPLQAYFTCLSLYSTWTHPTLTVETTSTSNFHPTVGPALPAKPVIGPGQLNHLLGNH